MERSYGFGNVLFYAFDMGLSTGGYSQFESLIVNSLAYAIMRMQGAQSRVVTTSVDIEANIQDALLVIDDLFAVMSTDASSASTSSATLAN